MSTSSNWADNFTYHAAQVATPSTVEEVQELVRGASLVKALGTRHSFSEVADTSGLHISTLGLDSIEVDEDKAEVTVGGGISYGKLCLELDKHGLAVRNLASLPHISVAGACATATHGSGSSQGNLAASVSAMEIVRADGELVRLTRDDEGFAGAVVHLGALGVVAKLTLSLVHAFKVRQTVYENLPFETLRRNFDEIQSCGYSISFFTDWRNETINQVWLKSQVELDGDIDPAEFYGALAAPGPMHPVPGMPTENCTQQMGVPGPSFARLPHFRMEFTPSSGEELQSEFFVPRSTAPEALAELMKIRDRIEPLVQVTEIRTVAKDDLWLSNCYERDGIGIHFTWRKDWPNVSALLPQIQAILRPFEARPHWGKLFTNASEEVRSLYPRLQDFQAMARSFDPDGKFRNPFLDRYIL